MAIANYILGFTTSLYRILGSLAGQIIETPLACHHFASLCAARNKTPWQLTEEDLDEAFKKHLGEEDFEDDN